MAHGHRGTRPAPSLPSAPRASRARVLLTTAGHVWVLVDIGAHSSNATSTYLSATGMFHTYARDSQRFRQVSRGFRRVSRGFRGGFAGVSRGFRGGFAGFRGRFAQFASLQIDSHGSRTLHLHHKVSQNSHPFHTFRTIFARFPKEFSPSFAAVSQPFHKPSRDFATVKRCEGVRRPGCP